MDRRLTLDVVVCALAGVLLALLVHAVAPVHWPAAFAFAVPLAVAAAPISRSVGYLCRAMPLAETSAVRAVAATTAAAVVTAGAWSALGYGWWRVLDVAGVAATRTPAPALAALLVAFGALGYGLSAAVEYLSLAREAAVAADRRVLESAIGAREAELRALRAQVDPHFLFNSLNSISGLIGADPARARAMTVRLAEFLRESLALGRAEWMPFEREAALARRYLEIEQVRFGARLQVVDRVNERAASVPVPPLILQPLVENAVRHGIATCLEGGEVRVEADANRDRLVVTIVNPRDPEAASKPGAGLGLDIVRRRLAAVYGDDASLAVEAREREFQARLVLPVKSGRSA